MFAVAFALVTTASAQDRFDAHGVRFAPGMGLSTDLVTTWSADVGYPGDLGAALVFDFADQTLVQVTEGPDGLVEQPLMEGIVGSTALFRAALHERIGVGVELPVFLTSRRLGEAQPAALGDLRLAVPVELLDGPLELAVVPFVDLPTGAGARLLGNGFGGGGRIAAAVDTDRVRVSGNLGGSVHPSASLFNLAGTPRLLASVGVSVRANQRIAISAEVDSRMANQTGPTALDAPVELLGSARWVSPAGVSVLAGVGTTLTQGAGSARLRAFLGATFAIQRGRDTDGDGIVDRDDVCLTEPESPNGYQDEDGCFDALSQLAITVRDPDGGGIAGQSVFDGPTLLGTTDSEGVLRLTDRLPMTVLALTSPLPEGVGYRRDAALEVTLSEGDAAVDLSFEWRPGTFKVVVLDEDGNPVTAVITFRGAEEMASGVVGEEGEALVELAPGTWSLVIENEEYGLASQEVVFSGDPDDPMQVVTFVLKAREVATTEEEVVVLQAVNFEIDSDELVAGSRTLLDEVAANLLKYERIRRVEVQGHTSSEGAPEYNLDLSQRRMEGVVRYLSNKGVAVDRLEAVGYGERCPLGSNASVQGRAENRRVQFIVLDPVPEEGVPCHGGNPARRAEPTSVSQE